jgi:hypothetical protein
MKTLFNTRIIVVSTLVVLGPLLLPTNHECWGAEPAKSAALPPGSLVLRGPSIPVPDVSSSPATPANTPEHCFGLSAERAMRTNGYSFIARAFDVDAFCRRFVPTLPASVDIKEQILAAPQRNKALLQQILDDAVSDIAGSHVRFLGVRWLGSEPVLLFRQADIAGLDVPGIGDYIGNPVYVAYVTERAYDGSVRLVDVQRFASGELLSRTMRRQTILELAGKGHLQTDRLIASDQALVSGRKALELFISRCEYGHFNLIKDAYERLAPELQENRAVLHLYATSGEQSIKDILVPIERWRQWYPGDPTPDLMVVNFYWLLYHGPRYVPDGPHQGVYAYTAWSPRQEEAVTAAIARANAWFADPAMEIRLAHHYGAERPEPARRLLHQALQRFPPEPWAFAELLSIDLATTNFIGVAETLHLQETLLKTNLTEVVNRSKDYAAFRKSFPWKKWQHDDHGVEVKALTGAAGQAGR